ncbi:attractin [Platysternon megacephalum]|uniref:Attractin n=1 Tax=Platysternon megacephalum TaxID=55544 RepID=A0A4D9EI39_9SAUR|nr:attractin [Platysternon megacephalum]
MSRGPAPPALLPGTSQQSWFAVWMEDRKLHPMKGCRSRCMDLPGHWLQEKHRYLFAFPLGDASSTLPLALLNCTVYTLGFTLFLLDPTPMEKQGRALLEEGLHNASAYGPESLV